MKRPRKGPDCFRALRVSDALSCGDFPRLPSAIPSYCPHCGKKL